MIFTLFIIPSFLLRRGRDPLEGFQIRRARRRGPISPFFPFRLAIGPPPFGERSATASDGRDVRRIGIRAAGLFTVTSSRPPAAVNPRLLPSGSAARPGWQPPRARRAYRLRRKARWTCAFRVLSKPLPRSSAANSPSVRSCAAVFGLKTAGASRLPPSPQARVTCPRRRFNDE